ncbi:MAG: FecR domain-containing protein [Elusimicrobiota bacterium]
MMLQHKIINSAVILIILSLFCIPAVISAPGEDTIFQDIVIKPGETLWSVANYYLKDPTKWNEILRYNKNFPANDPNTVLPGMRIRVPILLIKENLRAAFLVNLINNVQYRKKNAVTWNKAPLNAALYNEDGVKTGMGSYGQIKFYSGEILKINENSMVILRPEIKREEIELVLGEIRTGRSKVMTKSTVILPKITAKGGVIPDIRTKVKADNTTLVAVYKGEAEVTAQGKTITLPEGFGTEVKYMQAPSMPVALPPLMTMTTGQIKYDARFPDEFTSVPQQLAPKMKMDAGQIVLEMPKENEFVYNPSGTPQQQPDLTNGKNVSTQQSIKSNVIIQPDKSAVQQQQEKQPQQPTVPQPVQAGQKTNLLSRNISLKEYRLQIATDEKFLNTIVDEVGELGKNVDLKRALPDGKYYWRAAVVDAVGFESDFGMPQAYIIDTKPPMLEIDAPADNAVIKDEFLYIKGRMEKGAELRLNGNLVNHDYEGRFETARLLPDGKHVLSFITRDGAGNETKIIRNITKSYSAASGQKIEALKPGIEFSTATVQASDTTKTGEDKKFTKSKDTKPKGFSWTTFFTSLGAIAVIGYVLMLMFT